MHPTRLRWLASAIATLLFVGFLSTAHSTRPDQTADAATLNTPRSFPNIVSRGTSRFLAPLGATTTSTTVQMPAVTAPPIPSQPPSTTTTTEPETTTTVRQVTSTTVRPRAPPTTSTTVEEAPPVQPADSSGEYVSPIPRNSTEACIVRRENGDSYSQGTNPTHKGRYQFGRSTWIAHGGPASHWDDWSLTSPKEQDTVFMQTVQDNGGYGDWTRYDGC